MPKTTKLQMPQLVGGQPAGEVTHNESLLVLDGLVNCAVLDRDLTTPPAAVAGDMYIVGASATGAWAGKDKYIAYYDGNAWKFFQPRRGWRADVIDENVEVAYYNDTWSPYGGVGKAAFAYAGGGETVNGSWNPVTWDTNTELDAFFSRSGADITIKLPGKYLVTFDVSFVVTATAGANQVDGKLVLDAVDVPNSFAYGGLLLSSINRCAMSISRVITTTFANSTLRAEFRRAAGSSTITTIGGATRLTITRL